ncbi:MAG TPA: hypothetical protein VEA78_06095 [Acidimicrobiales bacterium]|nr:hypothetical protein [Acidimicrobiales bacterium]
MALVWLRHWELVLARIAERRDQLTIRIVDEPFDRLRELLAEWAAVADSSATFWWRQMTADDELRPIVDQWLAVGDLTDADFAVLDAGWAPESTHPMRDAVIVGVSAALVALGDVGAELRTQLDRPTDLL